MSTHLSLDDLVYMQPDAKKELEGLRAESSDFHALMAAIGTEECDGDEPAGVLIQRLVKDLRAEVDGLRKDCDSENHLLRLALDRESALQAEVERLRGKAALADEIAEHLRMDRDPELDCVRDMTKPYDMSAWLARYAALDQREEEQNR